jgi:hypothetical protein
MKAPRATWVFVTPVAVKVFRSDRTGFVLALSRSSQFKV